MSRPIRRLPDATASRIAAGEVIERPLSALKEVLENALDAGARRVEIRVERSLDQGFVVADDGLGIAASELELALERHATSKLSEFDDLDHLQTLGFRGEALPSIAAVSRLRLTSRPSGAEAAAFVSAEGGRVEARGAAARSPGTTVEVRELFFNTPARRKFLNSAGGELRAALRMIEGYALARPDVAFRMLVDDKERFEWGATGSRRERAGQIWGARHAEQLVEAQGERGPARVYALLGLPEHARSTREGQVFLVNGRWIQNPALSQALRHAYGNLIAGGRFPTAVLWVDVPPERLDVNVHPTKREVRFADDDAVFSLVAGACAQPLSKLYPPFTVVPGGGAAAQQPAWADRVQEGPPADESQLGLALPGAAPAAAPAPGPAAPGGAAPEPELWQLHRTYILAPVRGGLVIIDQHAAHERVLYEEARARLEGLEGVSQGLLFPALVDLTHAQFEMLLESGPLLRRLGWDLSPLGPPTVVIQGVPSGLKVEHPGLLLQDLLDGTAEGALPHQHHGGPVLAQDDILERLARSHACHAAVKAGDVLGVEDMRALVDRLFATQRPHGDPHGRPTFVRMELDELHRRFGRT